MDTYILDVQNLGGFITGIAIPFFGVLYAKFKGFKLASIDKRQEYNNLKQVVSALTENISTEEFLAIVGVVMEKKKKGGITAADAQEIGKLLIDAVATEEKK